MDLRNEKIITQVADCFRQELSVDRVVLAMLLLAWQKVSHDPRCPSNLRMDVCRGQVPTGVADVLTQLGRILNIDAFSAEATRPLSRLSESTLMNAISTCLQLASSGVLDSFDPSDAVQLQDGRDSFSMPDEVCNLMVALAGDLSNRSVYLPWGVDGQLAGRVMQRAAQITIEGPNVSLLPELIATIFGRSVKLFFNDPLRCPPCVQGGELQTFDVTMSMPPLGVKVDHSIRDLDMFDRFKEKTASMPIMALRHMLAQTNGRAVICSSNSLLFSMGAERALREDLLRSGVIEAVIALPAGLMLPYSAIPLTILVLNNAKRCQSVRFVNADHPRFKELLTRAKVQLLNIEELADLALDGQDGETIRNVSVSEVLSNDANLQVSRYVSGQAESLIQQRLQGKPLVRLGEIAELVKPVSNLASEDGTQVFEVGAGDIPDYGYIHTAAKLLQIDASSKKAKNLFLRPRDIVLIVKGSLGKVGIVADDVPPPGQGGWIVGQSAVVIRAPQSGSIDRRALFMLLRSGLGKQLLKRIATGTAIQFVQLKELEMLALPLPSEDEASDAIQALEQEELLQQQINALKQQQAELMPAYWVLPEIGEA